MSEKHDRCLSSACPKQTGCELCYAPAESILESIADGVFTVDADWRITSFNRAAEGITGLSRWEALGRRCSEVFRSDMCEERCALRRTMATGIPIINKKVFIQNVLGHRIPISVSTAVLRNRDNEIIGCAETFRDLSMVEKLRMGLEGRIQLGDVSSRSAGMRKIIEMLPQIAVSGSTVLIQGETGTGKELLARAIHNLSPRREKPLVALNCGALPDTLLESELFGYKSGAFTGAGKDKPGRFGVAEGGTLFLDEIGEVSPALQVRLLRVLQEKTYEPLGSNVSLKADVRVVAATNGSLADLVEQGRFRQDLFYRINVVSITLPPLRERKDDIPLLVDHFIAKFNLLQGKSIQGVSLDVMATLMAHDYPGNCRELENIIEHAFVLCSEGYITKACLPEGLFASAERPNDSAEAGMNKVIHAVEAHTILETIKRNNYNRVASARELGIHKSTLFRKIKNLGIVLPQIDGRCR